MKFFLSLLSIAALSALISTPDSYAQDPALSKTIVPPGKEDLGLKLFLEKGCYQCHSAGATKLPTVELAPRLVIELAGDVHSGWTRDDFAKAIMNPNHVVAEEYHIAMMRIGDHLKAENSPMPEFIDMLSLADLINLTTFLDTLTE